ncbi:hypothetical protein Ancab_019918, partial [Ancistrocladus abbreviatus]
MSSARQGEAKRFVRSQCGEKILDGYGKFDEQLAFLSVDASLLVSWLSADIHTSKQCEFGAQTKPAKKT